MDPILQRIIDELKSQKKNQYELTNYLSLTHNVFGNWKAGKNQSYKKYLHAIADFLGVSVEYLKGKTDEKHPPHVENSGGAFTEFLELFMSLTTDQQALIIAQMKGILANR